MFCKHIEYAFAADLDVGREALLHYLTQFNECTAAHHIVPREH